MGRKVTEQDFRMSEFVNANAEDYEFRGDGKIVRKDRWERGVRTISHIMNINHDWEVDEVVAMVQALVDGPKSAYAEGYGAFVCGESKTTNPYNVEFVQYNDWNVGYMTAKADHDE